MKGYFRTTALTAEERGRVPGVLLCRALIDLGIRACRDPKIAAGAAKRLTTIRRESEAKARKLLEI